MTGRHKVRVSRAARRQLDHLPERVAVAVVEFITAVLPENPARLSKPLTGELEGLRSARRGDYRVLLWIDDESQPQPTVVIVRIAHRADAYRDRPGGAQLSAHGTSAKPSRRK